MQLDAFVPLKAKCTMSQAAQEDDPGAALYVFYGVQPQTDDVISIQFNLS